MNRLDFLCKDWSVSPYATEYPGTRMVLHDFKEQESECWHLRGRAWRWNCIMTVYPVLTEGEEYEVLFWAKIDYYSGRGTICRIELGESSDWTQHREYDISPVCAEAIASSGDWVLYRYCFNASFSHELVAQIIAFEANVALMQAYPGDEEAEGVTAINHKEDIIPFRTFNEIPFREYTSLEQRMAGYYRDLLAPYHPCGDIPENSQKEYYEFTEDIYGRLFNRPEELFSKLYEDDAHPNRFNCGDYGRPELKRHMKSDQEKIEGLFRLLSDIVRLGEIKEGNLHMKSELTKKQREQLGFMGFETDGFILKHTVYKNVFSAIKYLSQKSLPELMFCRFDNAYPYLEKTFMKHYDKEQYERLTGWLHDNGYRIGSNSPQTLDYYKSTVEDEMPLGYAIHGDKFHYGFTFEFRPEPRVRQHCELRILQFGQMLLQYEDLSENTRQFISLRAKRCDLCRYCVQTDKTGTRPLAAITVDEGLTFCPYYPGYNFAFEKLSSGTVDSIIAFLTDMESIIMKC